MMGFCPQPPQWKWLTPRRPFPWLAVLLAVLAVELCMLPLRRPRLVAAPVPEGAVLVTSEWGEKPILRQVPAPGKGDPTWQQGNAQECKPHVSLSGYCWAPLDPAVYRPPCGSGLYESGNRCYAPVAKANPPRSLGK